MRRLIDDIVRRRPEWSHLKPEQILIGFTQANLRGLHGLQARVTPLRFADGNLQKRHRGFIYQIQRYFNDETEYLYLLTFCLPRFLDQDFDHKMVTLFHELYHIGPKFDGDLRRHTLDPEGAQDLDQHPLARRPGLVVVVREELPARPYGRALEGEVERSAVEQRAVRGLRKCEHEVPRRALLGVRGVLRLRVERDSRDARARHDLHGHHELGHPCPCLELPGDHRRCRELRELTIRLERYGLGGSRSSLPLAWRAWEMGPTLPLQRPLEALRI